MKFKDQVQFVRQNIKKNRLRIFMTILATTIGCAFLIVLASVGFGLHKSITSEILEQDIVTTINVFGKDDGDEVQMPTDEDLKELKGLEHVKAVVVNKYIDQRVDLSLQDRATTVAPIFTNIKEWKKTGVKLSEGRLPKQDGEVVVGYHFANYLNTEKERIEFEKKPPENGSLPEGYKGDLIGQTLSMRVSSEQVEEVIPVKVVGVLDEPANDWDIDTKIIISD
ncbi:ABC transporter permease [Bacillus sp. FJAT-47783]|uniref:ABC transporter permease n=1 Tax=Bacillus sp. FJAT-47783 TaxID=2922712 RepID=UPI00325FC5EA